MNAAQVEVLRIVSDEAIAKIAEAHGTDKETVKLAIQEGNEVACREFEKLCRLGFKVANDTIADLA